MQSMLRKPDQNHENGNEQCTEDEREMQISYLERIIKNSKGPIHQESHNLLSYARPPPQEKSMEHGNLPSETNADQHNYATRSPGAHHASPGTPPLEAELLITNKVPPRRAQRKLTNALSYATPPPQEKSMEHGNQTSESHAAQHNYATRPPRAHHATPGTPTVEAELLIIDKVPPRIAQRKITNARISAERANNYQHKAESQHQVGWGKKITARKVVRKALANWYETGYKNAKDEIVAQQIADNMVEINMMPEFMRRKGVKNSYVIVCPMIDWTKRRPVVLPLAGSRESLSGYMLYHAVAQELKLDSSTCLMLRPQRPWIPYVHKGVIFDPSVLAPRSQNSSCKHLLAQTLIYHIESESNHIESESDSDGEPILIVSRTLLVILKTLTQRHRL